MLGVAISTRVVGFNSCHASSVCLMEEGVTRFSLALERTARIKRGTVTPHGYAAAMADLANEALYRVVRESDRVAGHARGGHVWVGIASCGKRPTGENSFYELAPDGRLKFDRAAESLMELGFAVCEGDEIRLVPRATGAPFERFHFDFAAQFQAEFEEAVLHVIRHVLARSESRSLVLAVGFFLNSILNTWIMRETQVDRLFVVPAATDDGNAAGAEFGVDMPAVEGPFMSMAAE
jgi:predicted NodU family carbamoyl transferase